MRVSTHSGAVGGVVQGFDDLELVEHLAHHHDAGPHGGHVGGDGSYPWEREGKGPEDQEDKVHHGDLAGPRPGEKQGSDHTIYWFQTHE